MELLRYENEFFSDKIVLHDRYIQVNYIRKLIIIKLVERWEKEIGRHKENVDLVDRRSIYNDPWYWYQQFSNGFFLQLYIWKMIDYRLIVVIVYFVFYPRSGNEVVKETLTL